MARWRHDAHRSRLDGRETIGWERKVWFRWYPSLEPLNEFVTPNHLDAKCWNCEKDLILTPNDWSETNSKENITTYSVPKNNVISVSKSRIAPLLKKSLQVTKIPPMIGFTF